MSQRGATTAAAGLAGALGAADLFKRAAGHSPARWIETFAWDTWDGAFTRGSDAWERIQGRPVPDVTELGRILVAGVGAIGSALIYLATLGEVAGSVAVLDRDAVDLTNLNRSPLFTVLDAVENLLKTEVAGRWLGSLAGQRFEGTWGDCSGQVVQGGFDTWVSLTNEDGAWADVPFQLPPVVLHGTTTSEWGFGAGRHLPRLEDCTLCRMPRPHAAFRGPCGTGQVIPDLPAGPMASLPFLSTASAALVLAMIQQLAAGPAAAALPNDISADLGAGLPAVMALKRRATPRCRGCQAVATDRWMRYGGRGRFSELSALLSTR